MRIRWHTWCNHTQPDLRKILTNGLQNWLDVTVIGTYDQLLKCVRRGISIHSQGEIHVCLFLFELPNAHAPRPIIGLPFDVLGKECALVVEAVLAHSHNKSIRVSMLQGAKVGLLCNDRIVAMRSETT